MESLMGGRARHAHLRNTIKRAAYPLYKAGPLPFAWDRLWPRESPRLAFARA